MAVSAFSKVGDIDDDDEEEREELSQRAMAQYAKAQKAYENKVSCDEVLKLFEEAEKTMKPLLSTGLASLEAKELESVLKGRLHQAVSLAQLGEADRWPKIKGLAEDVLQFDFNNAHARWLRGLALHHHFGRREEAKMECERAVECARMQGKDAEAKSWEAEVRSTFSAKPTTVTDDGPADDGPATSPAANGAGSTGTVPEAKKSSMAKGFLNRAKGDKKPRGNTESSDSAAAAGPAPKESKVTAAEVEAFQRKEAELQRQVEDLSAQLKALEAERQQDEEKLTPLIQEIKELPEELVVLGAAGTSSAVPSTAEKVAQGRSWAEKEQQRFVDVSTEVLTLQQMTLRESKEQEDHVEKHSTELRALSGRLQEQLRQLRPLDLKGRQVDDEDVARLAHHVASFHQLPWWTKVSAMLEDGSVMWLLCFVVLLGMLFMLSLIVELWFSSKCRLTCEVAKP